MFYLYWYFFEEVFELLPNRDIQTLEAGGASDNKCLGTKISVMQSGIDPNRWPPGEHSKEA